MRLISVRNPGSASAHCRGSSAGRQKKDLLGANNSSLEAMSSLVTLPAPLF